MVPRGRRPLTPRYYVVSESLRNVPPAFWADRRPEIDALGDAVEIHPRGTRPCVSRGPRRACSPLSEEEVQETHRGEWGPRALHPDLHGAPHGRAVGWSWEGGSEGHRGRPLCVQRKPQSRGQQRPRLPPRPRVRPAFEPCLTDSDSVSVASSSDPQAHGPEQPPRATPAQELAVRLSGLICSDV